MTERVEEIRRGQCGDCGLSYHDDGFADLIVKDYIWKFLSPTKDEGGLLCPTCMCRKAAKLGIHTRATFTSGPFAE